MSSPRDIRRRMRAISSLRQMTHALSQVAAARAKRYRDHLRGLTPYLQALERAFWVAVHSHPGPLPWDRPGGADLVVALGTERGFCGSFNQEVASALPPARAPRDVAAVGSRLAEALRAHGTEPAWVFSRPRWGTPEEVAPLARFVTERLATGTARSLVAVGFRRRGAHRCVESRALVAPGRDGGAAAGAGVLVEPDPSVLLDHVLPRFVAALLRAALLESMASEEERRAEAMQLATSSADELLESLTRDYRRARQERITRELLEVVATVGAQG